MIKPRSATAVQAAVCLYALDVLKSVGLATDVAKQQVIRKLEVSRSYVYELLPKIEAAMARGFDETRDEQSIAEAAELRRLRVRTAVLEYRLEHPGSWVCGGRTVYSPELISFVLGLASERSGRQMTQADFAAACGIPLPTLKDWLADKTHQLPLPFAADAKAPPATSPALPSPEPQPPPPSTSTAPVRAPSVAQRPSETASVGLSLDAPDGPATAAPSPTSPSPEPQPPSPSTSAASESAPSVAQQPSEAASISLSLEMQRIVTEYEGWQGSLPAFVLHLRSLGLHYGREIVSQILHLAAARKLLRRPPPKPSARGSTFRPPPGVQWTSDGKQLDVLVDNELYRVNWQSTVDVGSTATVGSIVRPEEDTAGVLASVADGLETTGASPVALLLDNKACNKSPVVADALAPETFVMYATPGRGQNKAVVEGGFGLFSQALGPLIATIDTSTPEILALGVAEAVTRAYEQGRNHHPRRSDGRTPYELYRDADPSPEEIAAATERLRAIKERIDSREAREQARRDPAVAATIEHACQRFGFSDDGDLVASLSSLPLAAIQSAIAIYAAKQQAQSLPVDTGIRYFAGIARNCHHERELLLFEQELVAQLERTGQLVHDYFERKAASFASLDPAPRLRAIVNEMLSVTAPVAQVYWRRRFAHEALLAPVATHPALRSFLCEYTRRRYTATKQHRRQIIDLVVRTLSPCTPIEPNESPQQPQPCSSAPS